MSEPQGFRGYPWPSVYDHLERYPPEQLDLASCRTALEHLVRWRDEEIRFCAGFTNHEPTHTALREMYAEPERAVDEMISRLRNQLGETS